MWKEGLFLVSMNTYYCKVLKEHSAWTPYTGIYITYTGTEASFVFWGNAKTYNMDTASTI